MDCRTAPENAKNIGKSTRVGGKEYLLSKCALSQHCHHLTAEGLVALRQCPSPTTPCFRPHLFITLNSSSRQIGFHGPSSNLCFCLVYPTNHHDELVMMVVDGGAKSKRDGRTDI